MHLNLPATDAARNLYARLVDEKGLETTWHASISQTLVERREITKLIWFLPQFGTRL